MIVAVWLLALAAWVGHLGLLGLPASALLRLLSGQPSLFEAAVITLALVPQLFLIPWAWIDIRRLPIGKGARLAWRIGFFLTGFLAVTAYALRFRVRARRT